MLTVLRQTAITLTCTAVIYAALIGLSFAIYPADRQEAFDTGIAERSIYATPTKYLYFARTRIAALDRGIYIVGASNADAGLRPEQIQTFVPCAIANGATLGNMNISEMAQTVDLVTSARPNIEGDTFVLGIWYGDFGDSEDRWHGPSRFLGETDVEIELYRFGLYHRGKEGPEPSLLAPWLDAQAVLLRPLHMFEGLSRALTLGVRQAVFVRPPNLTLEARENRIFRPEERSAALLYWQQQFGGKREVSRRQFEMLNGIISGLIERGSHVVLVDLPIPSWHASVSVQQAGYVKALGALVAGYRNNKAFSFVAMSDLGRDEGFSDEVHPRPSLARLWAERVGQAIQLAACPAIRSAAK